MCPSMIQEAIPAKEWDWLAHSLSSRDKKLDQEYTTYLTAALIASLETTIDNPADAAYLTH